MSDSRGGQRSKSSKRVSTTNRNGKGMFFSASKMGLGSNVRANTLRKHKRMSEGFGFFASKNKSARPDTSDTKGKPKSRGARIRKAIRKTFIFMLGAGSFLGIVLAIFLGIYLKSLENSLPDPNKLVEWKSDESTIIYDRKGKELFKVYGNENRQFVSIDEIPDHTKWALLAAEDAEFYQHKGLDWQGIIRCGIISVRGAGSGEICGASTITQQLVRNTIMFEVYGDEAFERSTLWKSVRRKLREILLSMRVEQTLSKDEILQLYMNEVPLGGVNYGYGAAAKSYYDKDVSELTLEESAILSGIIASPGRYSPVYGTTPEVAEERKEYVFGQLERNIALTGISQEEIDNAREVELKYTTAKIDIEAYHWVFYVKEQLEAEYGVDVVQKGGLRVTTTIDMDTQKIAEEELKNGLKRYGDSRGVKNASLVAIEPNTGQIVAMVGSVDVNSTDPRIDGKVNIATSLRQTGSSFKPFVYFTAFQQYGPWMAAADIPYNFGGDIPTNWDRRYEGPMIAREALIKSRNLPANYTLETVGIDPVIANLEKMGVTTLTDRGNYGLSFALGAAEMKLVEQVEAYAVFATGGVKRDAIAILKVEDSKGNVLQEYKSGSNKGERIFAEEDVYLLNYVLCDLGGFGDQPFAQHYVINGRRSMCGKTGTTNGPKDLVSMQYNKNIVAGIWAGNNNGDEVPGAWSTTVPLPIMHSFMQRVAGKYKPELPSNRPASVASVTVCDDTGQIPSENSTCKKVQSVYVRGRGPGKDTRSTIEVCTANNKIASNLDQAKEFKLLKKVSLLDLKLENSRQNASYQKYLEGLSKSNKNGGFNTYPYIFSKPGEANCDLPLGPGGAPVLSFITPTNGSKLVGGEDFTVTVDARAKNSVQSVTITPSWAAAQVIGSAPYSATFTAPNTAGSYTISATVVDSEGKSATSSITVTVEGALPTITVATPAGGQVVTVFPLAMSATVANGGDQVTTVRFWVKGPASYFRSINATKVGNEWVANWDGVAAVSGDYTIEALMEVSGSGTVVSAPVSIKVAL